MTKPLGDLERRLLASFNWIDGHADQTRWWKDPQLLTALGPALADLHRQIGPTVVCAIEARGFILAPLVAQSLGTGLVTIRKDHALVAGHQFARITEVDYRGNRQRLRLRQGLIGPGDRALLVDDWIETGSQAQTARELVADSGAEWIGVATIVDGSSTSVGDSLRIRGLLRQEELGDSSGS